MATKPTDSKSVALTDRRVIDAKPPKSGRYFLRDTKSPGLVVMVTAAGSKSFYLYRRVNGQPKRVLLGKVPALNVAGARELAAKTTVKILDGKDPTAERRAAKADMTLGECFELFQKEGEAKRRPSTNKNNRNQFDLHLDHWRDRRLKSIQRRNVLELHSEIGKTSPYAANRVIALLSALFCAARRDYGQLVDNPAAGIERFAEVERERFLTADEMPRFFKAVKALESVDMRDLFILLLFTGARSGNLRSARWVDINLNAATWIIPSTAHKTKKPQTVALAPPAVEILTRRWNDRISDEFVFPSRSKYGHMREPHRAWAEVITAAKLPDLRIHDLRRSLGSWQSALDTPLQVIGKTLGHRRLETTMIYARMNIDPVRKSVNAAVDAITHAANQ